MIPSQVVFILEMTRRDFVERFAGSVLGALWLVIWPLVNMFVYIVIFGQVMGGRLPGTANMSAYGVYLAVGLIPWMSFSNTVTRSSSIFLDKKGVISKVKTNLPALLVYVNLTEIVTFLISMVVIFIILMLKGWSFNPQLLVLIPFVYYLQQIFALGIGLVAASLTVFVRDIKEILGVILQLWFWFTPIVYVKDILPDIVKKIMIFNPMMPVIESFQKIFVYNKAPDFVLLLVLTIVAHCLLFLAYVMFRYLEKDIRDFL